MSNVWDNKIFNGAFVEGGAGTLDVTAPATDEVIATVGHADTADLAKAVTTASTAQTEWAALPYTKRATVLTRVAALLAADPGRLTRWLVPESGSSQGKAAVETVLAASELAAAAALAAQPHGQVLRSMKPRLSLGRYVPVGIVGVITPFNAPVILAARSVAPALALGNAVILKPDLRTPISGGLALAELFTEAGLPEGLLHVLPGGADIGAALVAHPDVPCVSFTGSTDTGRRIGEVAAPLLKKLHLELGGNNALLVLPDADIDAAASAGAWGSFLHQGQICMTTGRHLVPGNQVEQYAAKLAEKAANLRVGDPTDPANALGPLIDESQLEKVREIVDSTVAAGATLLTGGTHERLFYRPTVLTNVPLDSPAFTKEIFGPVAPVVGYESVDEAIDIINSSEYGLSVGVLTTNPFTAFRLADRIKCGTLHINDQTVGDEAVAPFGGAKASGAGGRFGLPVNLDTFCDLQWVTVQSEIETYPF